MWGYVARFVCIWLLWQTRYVESAALAKLEEIVEHNSYLDSFASEVVSRVGVCHENQTLATISFPGDAEPLITVCHDETTDFTLWSHHKLYGNLLNQSESGGNRPSFKEADFYPDITADNCYKQVQQTETIGMLLDSTSLAQHYIQTNRDLFLARGHLAPNGDPIKAVEKHATFYFINASPQWQTINGGNWVNLETKIREIALNAGATLNIWTGSYGVTTLENEQRQATEIWLGRDNQGNLVRKLPVNHLTWKVVHHPETRTAVVVIQINNPWLTRISPEDIICDDVCSQITWVTWNTDDIVKGYTYCCTVKSFSEKVPYAPDLGDLPLMTSL